VAEGALLQTKFSTRSTERSRVRQRAPTYLGVWRRESNCKTNSLLVVQSNYAKLNIPMGRIAEVEEVANLVVVLASPLMTMVNGTMIEIDGGQDKPLMDRFHDKNR
jgi:NAD(P)-dependent dehydrogenase (short-subunit alcohol dehydrogenase family)